MIRKTTLAILAVLTALCFAVPAAAETFTSPDEVLSIDLPDKNWKQIEDPSKWLAFSDGGSVITIEHYSNGEKLPDVVVAGEHYVNVFQVAYSTQNEVFIITGSVADAAKIQDVSKAITSVKILKYDTKLAVKKANEISASEFSIMPLDKTMYVTAEWLNVRMAVSTDAQIIGGLGYGDSVKVTGAVQRNGSDTGWYQIKYEGGTGYVSGNFLSSSKPSDSDSSDDDSYTGAVKTVYDENGESYTLYEGTDGYWRDRSGKAYVRLTSTEFQVRDGNKRLTTYDPYAVADEDFYSQPSVTVYDEYGDSFKIYQSHDGYWREEDGTTYVQISDDEFQVRGGTKRLTTYYRSPSRDYDDDDDYIEPADEDFYSQPSLTVHDEYGGSFKIYQSHDGYWREEDGTTYVEIDDGEFQLKDGNLRVWAY